MPSDFTTFVDAVLDDLTTEVAGLRDEQMIRHRLAAWDPGELEADGRRHLACWPGGEEAEAALPFTTNANMLRQTYRLLYWESAGDESSRGIADEEAAEDLFVLHNATRDRLYQITQAALGGANLSYLGSAFPERSGQVRWFAIAFRIDTSSIEF